MLSAMQKIMPCETYVYLADSQNAPYGTKSPEEIIGFTENNISFLMRYPCKAVVIACNTATAAAVKPLRSVFSGIPIIGLEPALRPALNDFPNDKILVLATQVTLTQKKFRDLKESFIKDMQKNLVCVSAQKIVSFVESGMADSPALVSYLKSILHPYKKIRFSAVVLGCTHFPFAKKAILDALGYPVVFYDGGEGAAKQTKRVLSSLSLLSESQNIGSVTLIGCPHNPIKKYVLN